MIPSALAEHLLLYGSPNVKMPNPVSPSALTPRERQEELCRYLALGLLRLRVRCGLHETVSGEGLEAPTHLRSAERYSDDQRGASND